MPYPGGFVGRDGRPITAVAGCSSPGSSLREETGRRTGTDRHTPCHAGRVRVLVVEDELRLAANIAGGLREGAGYAVDVTHDGEEALRLCSTAEYDLIALDLMLPRIDGKEVVRHLRSVKNNTPILVLTAADSTVSKIDLLNLGADDYLTKPFDLGELIARSRALIRRGKGARQPTLQSGELEVLTSEQAVRYEGTPIELSPTEYRILEYLIFRPRTVVSKRELLEHLYDFSWEHHSNVIEAHISNLRRKLRQVARTDLLETLRGRGYRLVQGR